MTTTIPTPAPVPDPLSSDFGTKAYDFTVWMAEAAPAMTAVGEEMNEALNQSLLSVTSTSTSSIAIVSSGNVNLTVTPNKGYAIGMTVKIASVANPVNYIKGTVTAFTSSTGAMTVAVFNNGGSGTFASWSVFFDVPDPSVLSVPTGEAVAAGNLLAIDDAGNSMSAGSITTAVIEASTVSSFHACGLANRNSFLMWNTGDANIRAYGINVSGGMAIGAAIINGGAAYGTPIWSAQLSNGNIVYCYKKSTGEAAFRVIASTTGYAEIVAATNIESGLVGQIKCCALTGGGFAVTYNNASNNRYAVYANDGSVVLAPANNVTGAQTRVAICPTSAGGFVALAGTNTLAGNIYNAAGTLVSASAISTSNGTAGADVNTASISGAIAATGRNGAAVPYGPTISLVSDSSAASINSNGTTTAGQLSIPFSDLTGIISSSLGNGHIAALGSGNFIATFSSVGGSNEYPRYVIFNGIGQVVQSGILFSELVYQNPNAPVFVIPKDTNGFSLIWLAANQNIKFAQVKTGKIVGVSLGAVGSTHQYLAAGEATVASTNMLNVGSSKVNYSRQGTKVVI